MINPAIALKERVIELFAPTPRDVSKKGNLDRLLIAPYECIIHTQISGGVEVVIVDISPMRGIKSDSNMESQALAKIRACVSASYPATDGYVIQYNLND